MRATRPYTASIHTDGRCVLLWLWCGVYYHFNSAVQCGWSFTVLSRCVQSYCAQVLRNDDADLLPGRRWRSWHQEHVGAAGHAATGHHHGGGHASVP